MLLGASAIASAQTPSDPILMTVGGIQVPVSEFQYLRNKNNSQQQDQPQSLDEYVKMFVDYKLKVAAAQAAGLDTTAQFRTEYDRFKADVSRPYLRDKSVEQSLLAEAYEHLKEDVTVSHIMLDMRKPNAEATADSIRSLIVSGQESFESLAAKHSMDRGSNSNGGLMGNVVPGRYPWAFEKAAYDTPLGGISPVVNSGMGLHIIRVEDRQPTQGEVEASHILLLTRGLDDDAQARQLNLIDSIYNVATQPGADFAALARQYSQDPGSGANGGSLGYFSRGRMVQPFDSIAFALADGEISKPFKTQFGYHIIHRTGHRGVPPMSDVEEGIRKAMEMDGRSQAPVDAYINAFIQSHKGAINSKNIKKLAAMVPATGLDSAALARITASELEAYKIGNVKATFAQILPTVKFNIGDSRETVSTYLTEGAKAAMDMTAMDMASEELTRTNEEYRNLMNEYRDGILLYEVSNNTVWDRAAKDKKGLEEFFRAHASKYAWKEPKFKSVIIFAANDSMLQVALDYAETVSSEDPAEFVKNMREHFGRNIKIERVIAAKGENAITDYLAFGGERPANDPNTRWKVYAAYKGRIIDAPEEAADVRGAAVSDYQAELEKEWLEELHRQFPVNINQTVLDTLR